MTALYERLNEDITRVQWFSSDIPQFSFLYYTKQNRAIKVHDEVCLGLKSVPYTHQWLVAIEHSLSRGGKG